MTKDELYNKTKDELYNKTKDELYNKFDNEYKHILDYAKQVKDKNGTIDEVVDYIIQTRLHHALLSSPHLVEQKKYSEVLIRIQDIVNGN